MIAERPTALLSAPAAYAGAPLTAQSLGLALAWLTFATSSVVFAEPAPYDALMIGLIVTLPLLGLTSFSSGTFLFLIAWLLIGAAGFFAAARAGQMDVSIKHTLITFYLSFSAVLVAAFIRKNPERHSRLIISGYIFAALVAIGLAIIGYFGLLPGARDLFTLFDRARGPFKDPNVYGPFIVPALVYYVHAMATAPAGRAFVKSLVAGLFCLGLLISFSRGAWFNATVSITVYGYLLFIVAQTHRLRLKLIMIAIFGLCALALGFGAAMQVESIASLVSERASLALGYDTGPEGRFGGQLKALGVIVSNPLGIGALEFGRAYHSEDVHNVYLSMFLNAGWLGGFLYLLLVITTLLAGFRHALRRTPAQGLIIVFLASFAGLAAEGAVVDTDHWRHFYLVMGMLWGLFLTSESYRPSRNPGDNGRSGRI